VPQKKEIIMAAPIQGNTGEKKMDQAREHLQQAKENIKEAAGQGQQAASSAAQGLGQMAQNTASNVAQQARDTASNLGQKAQDVASSAQHKTDDALSSMGERVSSLAGTLRSSVPQEGVVGSTAAVVADKLDSTGRYLKEHGVSEIKDDLADIVRGHPIPSLLVVFGVGFLAGMAMRR
jgi:cell division septum initiation protein DivIVA